MALIAVVCAVIGTVTTIALDQHLDEQLNGKLHETAMRASGGAKPPGGKVPDHGPAGDAVEQQSPSARLTSFVQRGGPQVKTMAAYQDSGGTVVKAVVAEFKSSDTAGQKMDAGTLDDAQTAALTSVPKSGTHDVNIPSFGEYRVEYVASPDGKGGYYVALPTQDVTNTINTLILVEVSVTAAGLVAAAIAGSVLVGVALRPLRKVAATATRVS
ncbi:two-component sensor histidine kinase, partial [Streptomyces sp. NPDC052015]